MHRNEDELNLNKRRGVEKPIAGMARRAMVGKAPEIEKNASRDKQWQRMSSFWALLGIGLAKDREHRGSIGGAR